MSLTLAGKLKQVNCWLSSLERHLAQPWLSTDYAPDKAQGKVGSHSVPVRWRGLGTIERSWPLATRPRAQSMRLPA